MSPINRFQKITPFLWFDGRAEEAIKFYVSVFPNSEITQLKMWPDQTPFPAGTTRPSTVHIGAFSLDGFKMYAFDAGPMFKFNPSVSFFVIFESETEIDTVWQKLITGGQVLMPLDKYPWSDRYGWTTDPYGISWQLMQGKLSDVGQRITPLLMYSGEQRGKAEEAMNRYISIFENSSTAGIARYDKNDPAPEGLVKHAQCKLEGQTFMLMDNGTENEIPFNEAISFFIECKDQDEVDYFWHALTEEGKESACGWLKDKYGVSWQIVPKFLMELLAQDEPDKQQKLFAAINKMKKLDVAKLKEACLL